MGRFKVVPRPSGETGEGRQKIADSGSETAILAGCLPLLPCLSSRPLVPQPLPSYLPLYYTSTEKREDRGDREQNRQFGIRNGDYVSSLGRETGGRQRGATAGWMLPLGQDHPTNRGPVTHHPRASDNKFIPHPATGIVSNPLIPDQPPRSESDPIAHNLHAERSARQHFPTSEYGYRLAVRLRCANRPFLKTCPGSRTYRPTRPDPMPLSDGLITKGGGDKKKAHFQKKTTPADKLAEPVSNRPHI